MNEHMMRLRAMLDPQQQTWDLSPNDVSAIEWAVDEIARLKAKNQRLSERPQLRVNVEALFDDVERLQAENQKLRHNIGVLMDCRRYNQRCHECPDTECCNNTREVRR